MPKPLWERSEDRSACVNRSKTQGKSAGMISDCAVFAERESALLYFLHQQSVGPICGLKCVDLRPAVRHVLFPAVPGEREPSLP